MSGKRKIRAEFRKEHQGRRRKGDLTRGLAREDLTEDDLVKSERLSGKGELTRKRTVVGQESDESAGGLSGRSRCRCRGLARASAGGARPVERRPK